MNWNATNQFGAVTATAPGGPLGSAKTGRLANGTKLTYTVSVPAGAPSWTSGSATRATTRPTWTCSYGSWRCKQSADGDSEEAVTYANPAAGTYTVTVDGYEVPAGSTEYDYLDVFYAGAWGIASTNPRRSPCPRCSRTVTGR